MKKNSTVRRSARTGRKGYFLYHRDYFGAIEKRCGPLAEDVFLTILKNARVTDGPVPLHDGVTITLHRGEAVVSYRNLAERYRSSAASVMRAIKRLQESEYISCRPTHWLKHGLGKVPTIASIRDFDNFSGGGEDGISLVETWHEPKGVKKKEDVSPREECLSSRDSNQRPEDTSAARFHLSDTATAEDVLQLYRRELRDECDEQKAVATILVALERNSPSQLAAAIGRYAAGSPPPIRAENFFGKFMLPAYLRD